MGTKKPPKPVISNGDKQLAALQQTIQTALKTAFYKRGRRAYCKYCYTTHTRWERRTEDDVWFVRGYPFKFELVWICLRCDHATRDDFMQVGGQEQQGYNAARRVWGRMRPDGTVLETDSATGVTRIVGKYAKDGEFTPIVAKVEV